MQLVKSKGYILVFKKDEKSGSIYWYEQSKEDAYSDATLLKDKDYIIERIYEGPTNCKIYIKE